MSGSLFSAVIQVHSEKEQHVELKDVENVPLGWERRELKVADR